ncbi:unnamed protein product [Periconia digitata]|uniref:NB-ARC domain-containing protein n=1 Tax=Periconia digitata TaxID=1303443 RepID=A0A9W4XSQ7_9PLEO|nr:unnamed protein product [Periconia digitata]
MFFGTPHIGSDFASWGDTAARFVKLLMPETNRKVLKGLRENDWVLSDIDQRFRDLVLGMDGSMKIHSFQEACAAIGGKKIVDDSSSVLDLGDRFETVETISANHREMIKYKTRNDEGYRAVHKVLKNFLRDLESGQLDASGIAELPANDESLGLFTPPVELPVPIEAHHIIPPRNNGPFVGRDGIMSALNQLREQTETHARAALVGLGDFGKSDIALQYAHHVKESESHTHILWIHASNPTEFKRDLEDAAEKILSPEMRHSNMDHLQLMHDWLSDVTNGQWVMILDGVDDSIEPLERYIPSSSTGTVIVTSRNRVSVSNFAGSHENVIEVGPLEVEDAVGLFKSCAPFLEIYRPEVIKVVLSVDCMPYAIRQAGASIKESASPMPVGLYDLQQFKEQKQHILKQQWKDPKDAGMKKHSVLETWLVSFKYIFSTCTPAADILSLISVYGDGEIPTSLFKPILKEGEDQIPIDRALRPLLDFSLIKMTEGRNAVTVPQLVRLSANMWLEQSARLEEWKKESIRIMVNVYPSGEYGTWKTCEALIQHATVVIEHSIRDGEDALNKAQICRKLGRFFILKKKFSVAEDYLHREVGYLVDVKGPSDDETLSRLQDFGHILRVQEKFAEAEETFRRVIQGYESRHGPKHPTTFYAISHLGELLSNSGRFREAEDMLREALNGLKKLSGYGKGHPDTFPYILHLVLALKEMGALVKAEKKWRRAVKSFEKKAGPEHPKTVACRHNLGIALEWQEKYEDAEVIYHEILERLAKSPVTWNLQAADTIDRLVPLLWSQKRYVEAETLAFQGVEVRQRILGSEHPQTFKSQHTLSATFYLQGRAQEAISMMRCCVEEQEKALGSDFPDVISARSKLSRWQAEAADTKS